MSVPTDPQLLSTDSAAPKLCLRLLNGFELLRDGVPLKVPAGGQRMVALLGLAGPQNRVVAAEMLWPEATEERARGALRTAIWRLRGLCPSLIRALDHSIALGPDITLDTAAFVERSLLLIDGPPDVPEECLHRNALDAGDLLPGWYDEWVIFERERLRQLRMHALEMLSTRLVRRRRFAVALDVALEAVRVEPLRESAHVAVISVHLAEGNVVEARRHYRALRSLLQAELQVEPSPELTARLRSQTRVGLIARGSQSWKAGSRGE